ncbi:DUF5712 family protein [Polaribacter atrinae]|uniref:DUF5712 family protein n=1 Tax=Polaribacter atrinae TaxID=1333662 RepID=UPI0024920892|nr:DUF5712 family protein [Polaribacter atrinae]
MPISKPHSTLGATNISSCVDLAMYLEKENNELDKALKNTSSIERVRAIENRKQFFFSHSKNNISTNEVISSIDKNIKKLGKTDAKYFAPTINFSQQELKHIIQSVDEKKEFTSVWELNNNEYDLFIDKIKEYTKLIMTNYAKNFNREDKGLKSGNDLVYFAKIEHFRKFKGTDDEVKKGEYRAGDLKPGINSHVHIIVSRKDVTQKLKLTPITKERSTTRTIGGNRYHVGFDRMKWINMNEKSFDDFFQYKRKDRERFMNQYILKNGSPREKEALLKEIETNEQTIKNTINYAKNHTRNSPKRRSW